MSQAPSKLQVVVFRIFLVSCVVATVMGLLMIWGVLEAKNVEVMRIVASCAVIALAAAITLSAARIASGRADNDG